MVQTIIDSIATAAARLEELAHGNATILPNNPRSIQWNDSYSCGAKSAFCVLKYFGKP